MHGQRVHNFSQPSRTAQDAGGSPQIQPAGAHQPAALLRRLVRSRPRADVLGLRHKLRTAGAGQPTSWVIATYWHAAATQTKAWNTSW